MISIFDCFGVLVDWKSEYVVPEWAKYARVSEPMLKEAIAEDMELCESGHISMGEFWERLGKKFNVSPAGLEAIFTACFNKRAKLNDEVVDIVKSLPSAVLFSNQLPLLSDICRKNGWFSYFSKVFLSFDVGYMKPDKRSYLAVLKELGMPEAVFIDDRERNVRAAELLGIKGIVYDNPAQLKADLEKIYNVKLDIRKHGAA